MTVHLSMHRDRPPPKIKWHLLQKDEYAGKFKNEVVNKMFEMGDMQGKGANEPWNEMAECMRNVAKKVLGESSKR